MAEHDTGGLLQTVVDSFKSHVTERLVSPFAGAFVFAWLAVNWQALLVLAFSVKPIEERISYVNVSYFGGDGNVLWLPLLYSLLGILAYYISATIFLALYEVYAMLKRGVERLFDKVRWVSPDVYIKLKKESLAKIADLTELATDNLRKLNDLNLQLSGVKVEEEKVKGELSGALQEANHAARSIQILKSEISSLKSSELTSAKRLEVFEKRDLAFKRAVSQLDESIQAQVNKLLDLMDADKEIPRTLSSLYMFAMDVGNKRRMSSVDLGRIRQLAGLAAGLMTTPNTVFGDLVKSDAAIEA